MTKNNIKISIANKVEDKVVGEEVLGDEVLDNISGGKADSTFASKYKSKKNKAYAVMADVANDGFADKEISNKEALKDKANKIKEQIKFQKGDIKSKAQLNDKQLGVETAKLGDKGFDSAKTSVGSSSTLMDNPKGYAADTFEGYEAGAIIDNAGKEAYQTFVNGQAAGASIVVGAVSTPAAVGVGVMNATAQAAMGDDMGAAETVVTTSIGGLIGGVHPAAGLAFDVAMTTKSLAGQAEAYAASNPSYSEGLDNGSASSVSGATGETTITTESNGEGGTITTYTKTNEDGGMTVTSENSNGSTTTTTTHPDGSFSTATTNADGSSSSYVQNADGSSSSSYTDSEGNSTTTTTDSEGNDTTDSNSDDTEQEHGQYRPDHRGIHDSGLVGEIERNTLAKAVEHNTNKGIGHPDENPDDRSGKSSGGVYNPHKKHGPDWNPEQDYGTTASAEDLERIKNMVGTHGGLSGGKISQLKDDGVEGVESKVSSKSAKLKRK